MENKGMKRRILLLVLVLLIAGGGVAFYILSQPPKETLSKNFKEQAISKLLGRKAQLDPVSEKSGNVVYNGKYLSFDYPAKALIYSYKDPGFASSSSLLEDFSFDIKSPRLVLNLAVLSNNGKLKSIDDNPGVKFRQTSPGQYTEKIIIIDGHQGKLYSRRDENPEKTAFFLVNDKIYSIAITGTNFEEIDGLSNTILKTLKFKN
jgi:hypothetical protein